METSQLETTALEEISANILVGEYLKKSSDEEEYLNSMMSSPRQEGYTCVSGCSNCVSCGGND
jgi:hypothetical protein